MGYIDSILVRGERVVYRTKLHRWVILSISLQLAIRMTIFVYLGLLIIIAISSSNSVMNNTNLLITSFPIALIVGAIFGVIGLILGYVLWSSAEFGLTDRRVLIKTGVFSRKTLELNNSKIESFQLRETVWGRIIGYKHISLTGSGGTKQVFKYVANAQEFKRRVVEQSTEQEETALPMSRPVSKRKRHGESQSVFDDIDLPQDTTQDQLRQAAHLIKSGDRAGAQALVKTLMETAPDNADVWYLVGYLSSDTDRKRSAFRRALGIDPAHKKALSAMNALS